MWIAEQSVGTGGTGIFISVGPSTTPASRHSTTLPNPRGFLGRSRELQESAAALSDPARSETLVVAGEPGVGKTYLAVQFAELYRERYPGGTFFVDFQRDEERRLSDLRAAFPDRTGDRPRHLLSGISRATLLIYDGVPSTMKLDDWLPSGPIHVIITTRDTSPRWATGLRRHLLGPLSDADAGAIAEQHLGPAMAQHRDELVRRARGNARWLVDTADSVAKFGADCPYSGLEPYSEAQQDFFFGRAESAQNLLKSVREHPVVAVYGRSGGGKSSLVRAGLLPRLRSLAPGEHWHILQMRPEESPLHALVAAIQSNEPPDDVARCLEGNVRDLRANGIRSLESLLARRFGNGTSMRVLLFVDQWEELYLLGSSQPHAPRRQQGDTQQFIALLKELTRSEAVRAGLVVTVRSDYYVNFHSNDFHGHSRAHDIPVGSLRENDVIDLIRGPAERAGLALDEDLIAEIASDVGSDEALLPLLQCALRETWARREGLQLTRTGYLEAGRVSGALISTANRIYEQLDAAGKEATRELFLAFVIPGEGEFDTCARIERPSPGLKLTVAEKFAAPLVRILVMGTDSTGQPTVGVAHEALVRRWPRLTEWVRDTRERLRLRATILRYKDDWQKNRHRSDALLHGYHLQEARALLAAPAGVPVDDIRTFILLSEKREARARRLRKWVLGVLGACSLFFLVYLGQQNLLLTRRTTENAAATQSLRESLARYMTMNVEANIRAQYAALSRLARDPRLRELLERTAGGSGREADANDDRLLEEPAFYSTLLLDKDGCPVALWPLKRAIDGRARALEQCRSSAGRTLTVEENAARDWWARSFHFREYFESARRAAVGASPPPYPVSRSFRSEDDQALKYAISLPIEYADGQIGVLLGTAPGELGRFDGGEPSTLVTGLVGARGAERDRSAHQRASLLLLRRSDQPDGAQPLLESPTDALGRGILDAVSDANLEGGTSGACPLEPSANVQELSWVDAEGHRWRAAIQSVGCAGLVAFAATRAID